MGREMGISTEGNEVNEGTKAAPMDPELRQYFAGLKAIVEERKVARAAAVPALEPAQGREQVPTGCGARPACAAAGDRS